MSALSAELIELAAERIRSADALWIGAGAGMGVDSGLPDFRGDEGFWKAYPPFRGRAFARMSTPHWFQTDPQLAWGFFGHRLHLYGDCVPHEGFRILQRWGESRPAGYFVFTSNVDGQFQRSGFPENRLLECHGSIHHLQCAAGCCNDIWSADGIAIAVDSDTIRATSKLPTCRKCGGLARPNILMFNDGGWLPHRSYAQEHRYRDWQTAMVGKRVVAIEIGAGLGVPTVRVEAEDYASTLIRINPREPEVPSGAISLPGMALKTLQELDAVVG